jgi:hypothetical protein
VPLEVLGDHKCCFCITCNIILGINDPISIHKVLGRKVPFQFFDQTFYCTHVLFFYKLHFMFPISPIHKNTYLVFPFVLCSMYIQP